MFHLRRLQHDRIIGFAFFLHKLLFVVCLPRAERATCEFLMSHGGKCYRNLEKSSLRLLQMEKEELPHSQNWLQLLELRWPKLIFGDDELGLDSPRWRSWSPPSRGRCPSSRAGLWKSRGAAASCSVLCTCSASTGEKQVKPSSSRMEWN